jgi:hypothetical protein
MMMGQKKKKKKKKMMKKKKNRRDPIAAVDTFGHVGPSAVGAVTPSLMVALEWVVGTWLSFRVS